MNYTDTVAIGLSLVALAVVVHHFVRDLRRAEKRGADGAVQAGQIIEEPPPEHIKPRSAWYPMPCGTRLELGATGFWIELDPRKKDAPYRAFTPEGAERASSNDLAALKRFIEGEALERAEFVASRGWRP